jgi:hypothetical protein
MRLPVTFAAGIEVHKNAAVLDLDGISGYAIVFEAWLASPAAAVKFPIMPRADNIIAIQPAFSERPTDMVAYI